MSTSQVIEVLANDRDRGEPFDPASVTVTQQPENGTAMALETGEIRYEADNLLGAGSFSYTVDDVSGRTSNEANVTVQPMVEPASALEPVIEPLQDTLADVLNPGGLL